MPLNEAAIKLRQAVAEELAARARAEDEYIGLRQNMEAYQAGEGEPPSDDDFHRWRDLAQLAVREKKLLAGLIDL